MGRGSIGAGRYVPRQGGVYHDNELPQVGYYSESREAKILGKPAFRTGSSQVQAGRWETLIQKKAEAEPKPSILQAKPWEAGIQQSS